MAKRTVRMTTRKRKAAPTARRARTVRTVSGKTLRSGVRVGASARSLTSPRASVRGTVARRKARASIRGTTAARRGFSAVSPQRRRSMAAKSVRARKSA